MTSADWRSRIRRYAPLIALSLASTLMTLLALELGFRLARSELFSTEHLLLNAKRDQKASFFDRDPILGWVPRPQTRVTGRELGWDKKTDLPGTAQAAVVTTLDDGLRSNGSDVDRAERPVILTVGDSFTFGAQVSDHDSWPSVLEHSLGVRVLNGGVSGYGLDQAILRAEQLAPKYQPDLLIVSFINADLLRTTTSSRDMAPKPYFRVREGALEFANTPVPPPEDRMDLFRRVFGHSRFVGAIMDQLNPRYWREGPLRETLQSEDEIGCLLMARLEKLGRRMGSEVLVMLQKARPGEPPNPSGDHVLSCAEERGLSTLNLFPILDGIAMADPMHQAALFFGHMTPLGNEFVAEVLAHEIHEKQWLK